MAAALSLMHDTEASRALSEAMRRVADFWHLSDARLGEVLGLSAPTISRLRSGAWRLAPGSKPFELAQHLLRLFRLLDAWLGQDDVAARSWLATPNLDLGAAPLELIGTVRALLRTGDYVDALRARV